MSSLLPHQGGALPYWLLLTSVASVFNTIVCYTSETTGRRLYQGPASTGEVTALSTRLFGTWTLLSSIVRIYTAYNMNDKGVYYITLSTFAIALANFSSEWLYYKTMSFSRGLGPSWVVAVVSIAWMVNQTSYYTNN